MVAWLSHNTNRGHCTLNQISLFVWREIKCEAKVQKKNNTTIKTKRRRMKILESEWKKIIYKHSAKKSFEFMMGGLLGLVWGIFPFHTIFSTKTFANNATTTILYISDKRIGRLTLKSMIHISVVCVQYCLKIELKLFDTGWLLWKSSHIELVVYRFSFFPCEICFMHVLRLFYFCCFLCMRYCVIQISAFSCTAFVIWTIYNAANVMSAGYWKLDCFARE